MSREKTLVKNTVILTVGKICTQMITFFLLPLYTSILTTEEYGIVDLLNTLVYLLLPIITFQVEQALFRKLIDIRDNEVEKKRIISTGIFSVIIQCFVYIIIFGLISPFIHNEYKIFLVTNVIAYMFASIFQQIARGLGDNKSFSISSFVSAAMTILFNILFLVVFKLGAKGMLLGNMIGQVVCSLYLIKVLRLFKYISFKAFKYEILKNLWKYSVPLIPNAISWWIFNASDRIIVSAILGVGYNGILSAAHKFSSIYITIYNIFHMSWIEMISVHINDKDIKEFFNKMFNIVLKVFVTIGVGIIACMPIAYPIMINSDYYIGFYQVPIMILGSIFNVVIGLTSVIYIAQKDTKAVANTAVVSAIINIIVHLILIRFVGLFAATLSTLIAYMIMSIYRIYDIQKKYFKINIDRRFIIQTLFVLIFILIIYYLENLYLNFIGIFISVIYGVIVNKNTIYSMFNIIKNKIKNTKEVRYGK